MSDDVRPRPLPRFSEINVLEVIDQNGGRRIVGVKRAVLRIPRLDGGQAIEITRFEFDKGPEHD
jgi:hypothetical protein